MLIFLRFVTYTTGVFGSGSTDVDAQEKKSCDAKRTNQHRVPQILKTLIIQKV